MLESFQSSQKRNIFLHFYDHRTVAHIHIKQIKIKLNREKLKGKHTS